MPLVQVVAGHDSRMSGPQLDRELRVAFDAQLQWLSVQAGQGEHLPADLEDRYLVTERELLPGTRQRQARCLELVLIHDVPLRTVHGLHHPSPAVGAARQAAIAAAVSSAVRSALIAAAAVTPEAAACMTPAVTSAALPATHTPAAAVSPVASAWTWWPMPRGCSVTLTPRPSSSACRASNWGPMTRARRGMTCPERRRTPLRRSPVA